MTKDFFFTGKLWTHQIWCDIPWMSPFLPDFHRNHPQTFKKALLLLRYICLVVISALSRKARGSELSKQFFILVCELANQVLLLLLLQPQNSRGSDNATTINHTGTSTPPKQSRCAFGDLKVAHLNSVERLHTKAAPILPWFPFAPYDVQVVMNTLTGEAKARERSVIHISPWYMTQMHPPICVFVVRH